MASDATADFRKRLNQGLVIPAIPLALDASRRFDERRQRALLRYYAAAGAGGIAVAVHTTQFEIRQPQHNLLEPVLSLTADELDRLDAKQQAKLVRVAGVCGKTDQAVAEATLARRLGYHAGLLSLAAMRDADDAGLIAHCRAVGEVIPLIGFYLQTAVGGRPLPYAFWRRLAELDSLVAVKMAPFDRYKTLDVVRAIAESGREDVALYTGNDDHIVMDLLTPFRFRANGRTVERRIVGGLLGQWAVWTGSAVEILRRCHEASGGGGASAGCGDADWDDLMRLAVELTDANAAVFDVANSFGGCICGIHEILRRQGLLAGTWCLNPHESLGPGQMAELDRVCRAYPHLADDAFVAEHLDEWLKP